MISQIFILSLRGDVLAFEDFRYDIKVSTPEQFFGLIKECKGNNLDPILDKNGVLYFHILRDNLYFVATSVGRIGLTSAGMAFPITVIEILKRFHSLCKDFCGIVSEDSICANVFMVHEILGQFLDNGYVQLSTADKLKPCIMSEAKPITGTVNAITPDIFEMKSIHWFDINAFLYSHLCSETSTNMLHLWKLQIHNVKQVLPSNAANKPIVRSWAQEEKRENEIFIDVVEKLVIIINPDGTLNRSEVFGEIQMKCFLSGQPKINIGLNEGLVINEDDDKGFGSLAHVNACRFHERVSVDEFATKRILLIQPPEGHFTVMNYQVKKDLPNVHPFHLLYTIDSVVESEDMEITLRLRCNIPASTEALRVAAHLPVPKSTTSFMQKCNGPWQVARFDVQEKKIIWEIKKFPGGSEATAKFRLIHGNASKTSRLELGPLALVEFEISSYVCSNIHIRFLKVLNQDQVINPRLWVRYVTICHTYLFKLHV